MHHHDREIHKAATMIRNARRITVLSGAGMSAESNIPTFRDAGGLWDHIDVMEAGTAQGLIRTIENQADTLFPLLLTIMDAFEHATPNPGHLALAEMERMGMLHTIITQNIDNLHQEAGNTHVVEMHGNLCRSKCLGCGHTKTTPRKALIRHLKSKIDHLSAFDLENLLTLMMTCPHCTSVMRPDVVMFDEEVHDIHKAFDAAGKCDVMLVPGTSGAVYPAAYFPVEAKQNGASIIVINPSVNAFMRESDIYIPMKTGEALPAIMNLIKN